MGLKIATSKSSRIYIKHTNVWMCIYIYNKKLYIYIHIKESGFLFSFSGVPKILCDEGPA